MADVWAIINKMSVTGRHCRKAVTAGHEGLEQVGSDVYYVAMMLSFDTDTSPD